MTRLLVLLAMLACASGPTQTATPDTSDRDFEKAMDSLVEQLVSWLPQDKKPLVAVLDLEPLSGPPTDLERFLGEELTSRLFATRRANVVERAMLKKVLDELKRSASPAMDPHAASRLGQLTGADYVVAGRTSDLGTGVRVSVRAIDTTKGTVIATGVATLPKTRSTRALQGDGAPAARTAAATATPPSEFLHVRASDFAVGDRPPTWGGAVTVLRDAGGYGGERATFVAPQGGARGYATVRATFPRTRWTLKIVQAYNGGLSYGEDWEVILVDTSGAPHKLEFRQNFDQVGVHLPDGEHSAAGVGSFPLETVLVYDQTMLKVYCGGVFIATGALDAMIAEVSVSAYHNSPYPYRGIVEIVGRN